MVRPYSAHEEVTDDESVLEDISIVGFCCCCSGEDIFSAAVSFMRSVV